MTTAETPMPSRTRNTTQCAPPAVALLGSVVAANLLTTTFGPVPAGFGLTVTAGTYTAGLALAFRDLLHDAGGIRWVAGTITIAALVSWAMGDERIAAASAAAFLVSEVADLLVYAPLRRRNRTVAVAASNTVGAAVDTLLFLTLAGFEPTAELIAGQILVKAIWVTAVFLLLATAVRRLARP